MAGRLDRLKARREPERVLAVALAGVALSWATYEIVYWLNPYEPRATTSWVISFLIGVARQHHLHRMISFPGSGVRYMTSLRRDFTASLALMLLSSALNWFLTGYLDVHHRIAWVVCVTCVAAGAYALMKFYVFRKGPRDDG